MQKERDALAEQLAGAQELAAALEKERDALAEQQQADGPSAQASILNSYRPAY